MPPIPKKQEGDGDLDEETGAMKKHAGFAGVVVDDDDKEASCAQVREYYDYGSPHLNDARCPATFTDNDDEDIQKDKEETSSFCCSCWPFRSWSRERAQLTIMGCSSSCLVLGIRLYLDREPFTYFIHSIIVFLDMILIHLFTNTWWLSLFGELVTIVYFLLFHYERDPVYALLEMTLIAVLCSFQMIASRSQVKDKNEKLQGDIRQLRRQTVLLMRLSTVLLEEEEENNKTNSNKASDDDEESDAATMTSSQLERFLEATATDTYDDVDSSTRNVVQDLPPNDPECRRKAALCGGRFFEHFLDGSAGVVFTSFLGLIITELIRYGETSNY